MASIGFCKRQLLLVEINHVIYFSQSQFSQSACINKYTSNYKSKGSIFSCSYAIQRYAIMASAELSREIVSKFMAIKPLQFYAYKLFAWNHLLCSFMEIYLYAMNIICTPAYVSNTGVSFIAVRKADVSLHNGGIME